LGLLEGICEKFGQLMGAARGEMELVITSASKLDERMVRRLEQAVSKSEYSQGKKIKVVTKVCLSICHSFWERPVFLCVFYLRPLTLSFQVNPEILGGLVVEIGDRTIDYSVSAKIAKLNKLLTDTV
jgi:F-type H+-transporting ATPase subunit O